MPQKLTKPTLKELNEILSKSYINTRKKIMYELGVSTNPSYYNKINNPSNLSPAEREVFAKYFNLPVDEIDWQDKSKLIA